jgi:hypothetical protein
MLKRIFPVGVVWVLAVVLLAGSSPQGVQRGDAPGPQRPSPQPIPVSSGPGSAAGNNASGGGPGANDDAALLKQYCITCHNERAKTGGLVLDAELTKVAADRERWEKVVRKLKTGMMPPANSPRPARERLDAFAAAMETRLDAAADPKASLDTPALHRLNRNEYANAVRDLLDLNVDVSGLLPADGSSDGFDNIAEALSVSPSLIQGYVSAAMKISRLAVGDRTMAPSQVVYPGAAGAGAGQAHRRAADRDTWRYGRAPHVPAERRVRVHHRWRRGRGTGGRHGRDARRRAPDRAEHTAVPHSRDRWAAHDRRRRPRSPAWRRRRRRLFGFPVGNQRVHRGRRRSERRDHGTVHADWDRGHTEPPQDLLVAAAERAAAPA